MDKRVWYDRNINDGWKAAFDRINGGFSPEITAHEALAAIRLLWRYEFGKRWPGKPSRVRVTSGRRYTHVYTRGAVINPAHGWPELIHSLSHRFHALSSPNRGPHGGAHASVEKRLTEYVINAGWLAGTLKAVEKVKVKKPKPNPVVIRHARVLLAIKRWETKAKRAETALKKLRRQQRYYERSNPNMEQAA